MTVPEGLRWEHTGWVGVAVLDSPKAKLVVDRSIPTDRQLTERRPDLVAYFRELKHIVIFEIACAWEPLVLERENKKRGKYRELAADLATQWPGWKVTTVPLVVGALGTLNRFREELSELKLFSEKKISWMAREAQFEALVSATRLVCQHLAH